MSLNQLINPKLDIDCKSIKVNNSDISSGMQFKEFVGSIPYTTLSYLSSGNDVSYTGGNIRTDPNLPYYVPYDNFIISGFSCEKANVISDTTFEIWEVSKDLVQINLKYSLIVGSNFFNNKNMNLNIPIQKDSVLMVSTTSINPPQLSRATIYFSI
jgi:hypothetical protein